MNLKIMPTALSFMNIELGIGPTKKELPQIRNAILKLKFCQEREGRRGEREIRRERREGEGEEEREGEREWYIYLRNSEPCPHLILD